MVPHAGRLLRHSLLAAILIGSIGCLGTDGFITDPAIEGEEGSASFNFVSSERGGTFNASGRFSRNSDGVVKQQSFATAVNVFSPQLAYYGIVAAEYENSTMHNLSITISDRATGEFVITSGENCAEIIQFQSGRCAAISYELDLHPNGDFLPDVSSEFTMTSGTLKLTEIADGRIKGTFSGSAQNAHDIASEFIDITNGRYDVPVLSMDEWTGTM